MDSMQLTGPPRRQGNGVHDKMPALRGLCFQLQRLTLFLTLCCALALAVMVCFPAHHTSQQPKRSTGAIGSNETFVHLFEWSWADIAQECEEWLGPKGFSAVQISPPSEHIQGSSWWTRYQPVTYNLTSRSGDEHALADMVERCLRVGVSVYADAVINHVAAGSGVGIAGSPFGGRSTPIYSPEDFHHSSGDLLSNCVVSDYRNKYNVQYCDLVGLPDLCTSCPHVQEVAGTYLDHLMQLKIAGFRIDAAKHQAADELSQLLKTVRGTPYIFQEVISGMGEAVVPDMYFSIGQVTEFNYARQLAPNFAAEGKLKYLDTFGESWGLIPGENAVVFLDNHDTQRGEAILTYKSGDLYTIANVFMLAHPYGYPKVMSSYYFESHDQGPPAQPVHGGSLACGLGSWVCEHRRPEIANMVAWRRAAGSAGITAWTNSGDGNSIAFCRGHTACIAINRGNLPWMVTIKFTLPPGQYRDVMRASEVSKCPLITVDSTGETAISVPAMSAVALHVEARGETAFVEAVA